MGIALQMCAPSYAALVEEGNRNDLSRALWDFKGRGARVVFVLLNADVYPLVKLAGDSICLPTQCIKWQNLSKPPRNYHTSLLIKLNSKLGGINHTLASRLPMHERNQQQDDESFQQPPKSISWLFDEPYNMVMVSGHTILFISFYHFLFRFLS
jgi:hypothetical protein